MAALLVRDPLVYARLFGAVAVAAYVVVGGPFVAAFAWSAALLATATAMVMWRAARRRGSAFTLLEYPPAALIADLAAATLGAIGAAPNPRSIGFIVVIAVGAFASVRLRRVGFLVTGIAFVVTRATQELIRLELGIAGEPTQLVADTLIASLFLALLAIVVEAYRAEHARTHRALDRAHSLEDVALEIAAETDPERVLRSIPRVVRDVIRVDHAALIVRRGDEFEIVAGAGTAERVIGVRAPSGAGIVGEVMATRRAIVLNEYSSHRTAPAPVRAIGLQAALGVPIFVHGGVAAVLMCGRLDPQPFDREEVRVVEAFASHAAVALANARQLEQARRLEAVSRAAADADAKDVLPRIGREIHELFGYEWVAVAELDGMRARTVACYGLANDLSDGWVTPGPTLRRVIERRALVTIPDYSATVAEDEAQQRTIAKLAKGVGLRAMMAAPVLVDGTLRAALVVGTTDPLRTFDRIEQAALLAFADTAAATVRAAAARADRERRIQRLAALNVLAWELAQVREPLKIARLAWETCGHLVTRDAFYIARYDDARREFRFLFQQDERVIEENEHDEPVPLGTGPTSQVIVTGSTYVTYGEEDPVQHRSRRFGDTARESASAVHVPLKIAGRIVGVLSAQSYTPSAYDDEDMEVLQSLGNLVASAFANAEHIERGRELYLASVRALAAAVDARDPYTRSHSARVAALARLIAEEMDLPPEEIRRVQLGALLHDIGKIGTPDAILNKPAALTPEEWVIMRTHSAIGASIVAAVEPLRDLVPIVRAHHERHDGTGYPDGLRGAEIPLASSIVAAADAYEVIVSKRAYKAAQSVDHAISELVRWRGLQFRPDVVDAFLRVIERDRTHGSDRLERVRTIQHEDIEDLPGPGEVVERYAARAQVHTRQLAILQRLASEISAVLDIDELSGRLLRIVCESMGYELGFLLTLDDDRGALVVRAAVGPSDEFVGTDLSRGQGISWWVLEHGEPQNVADVHADTRYIGPPDIRSSLVVPLRMGDERIGVLGIESTREGAFTRDDEELLTAVSHQVAAAIRVARLHELARNAAQTDALTDLPNRRAFFERLRAALERGPDAAPLALAIVDVDLLKAVNDRYGHSAGDEALVRIARVLQTGVRGDDLVARIGGDEFGVIFAGTAFLAAERIMRRLAQTIGSSSFSDGRSLPTISYGVAAAPETPTTPDALVDAADLAMYRQKQGARARTTA